MLDVEELLVLYLALRLRALLALFGRGLLFLRMVSNFFLDQFYVAHDGFDALVVVPVFHMLLDLRVLYYLSYYLSLIKLNSVVKRGLLVSVLKQQVSSLYRYQLFHDIRVSDMHREMQRSVAQLVLEVNLLLPD